MVASLRIGCAGCPADERDPWIHMLSDRRREKVSRHLSQLMVGLYCWLNLVEIIVANLLYTTVADGPISPDTEKTSVEKQPCSTSLTL